MDTSTNQGPEMAAYVAQQIDVIKTCMPQTYQSIQARAVAGDLGRKAFELVRRGIRGEPNCFYAVEGGHVVGTGFNMPDVTGPIAVLILRFGLGFLIMWPEPEQQHVSVPADQVEGGSHGAH